MEREAIERLAIDAAAGQLNQDAEALLRTYLAGHPKANEWAEDMLQIYDKTETAIKTKTAHASIGEIAPKIGPVSRVRWLSITRWAAVIALGIIIGFMAGRWNQTDNAYKITSQESRRDQKQIETVSDLRERYAGTFWGDKMLALMERKGGQWYKAKLRNVRSWDKYRQYIKEKNHE